LPDHSTSRRTLLAGSLTGTALGSLLLTTGDTAEAVTVPTDPASDFFLTIPGIPGDSLDANFPKQIEVLDWSWGVTTAISPTNPGSGASKSKPSPFTFVSRLGSASPKLFLACAQGTSIPSATLSARHSGAGATVYLVIKLKTVFVTSYQVAPGPVDAYPLDVVRLEYGAATITYNAQSSVGGPPTAITAGFNFLKDIAL
jgi:type VI secretion system secreted protein Hcp